MKGPLRWVLLLVLIFAVVVIVIAVPFSGRTLLDRLVGDPPPAPEKHATQEESSGDQLTTEDRQGLDKLIESKLEQKPAGEGKEKK